MCRKIEKILTIAVVQFRFLAMYASARGVTLGVDEGGEPDVPDTDTTELFRPGVCAAEPS